MGAACLVSIVEMRSPPACCSWLQLGGRKICCERMKQEASKRLEGPFAFHGPASSGEIPRYGREGLHADIPLALWSLEKIFAEKYEL